MEKRKLLTDVMLYEAGAYDMVIKMKRLFEKSCQYPGDTTDRHHLCVTCKHLALFIKKQEELHGRRN